MQEDINLVVGLVVDDLVDGGNLNMVNTAKLYFDGNNNAQFIKGEIDESVYSYGEQSTLWVPVSRNWQTQQLAILLMDLTL